MAISLQKGGNVSLSKEAPGMQKMLIGLGWDVRATDGADFDLDGSAFLLNASGKVRSDADFIFYNQPKSADGSVVHTGDNRTGAGDGDDEQILVDLSKIEPNAAEIFIVVTIHEAAQRGQNFGQVRNSFIRIFDPVTNQEMLKYELEEDFSIETAVEFGRIYKRNGEWKFEAVGMGMKGGLKDYLNKYN